MGPDYSEGSVLFICLISINKMYEEKGMFSESDFTSLLFTLEQIISALPQLYGREAEVVVRCTKMLHNRRDYLRRRAKVRQSS